MRSNGASSPASTTAALKSLFPACWCFETAMELVQAQQFVISEQALREGLVIDWMLRHDLIVDRFAYQSEIRRRTVLHQARKFGVAIDRAERVAGYAMRLFDQTCGFSPGRRSQPGSCSGLLRCCTAVGCTSPPAAITSIPGT